MFFSESALKSIYTYIVYLTNKFLILSVVCLTLLFFTAVTFEANAAEIKQYDAGIVVYADGSAGIPKYKVFDDLTGLGAEQSATTVGGTAIEWIRVAASPVRDEWIIVTRDAGDRIAAQVCTGINDGISCGATTTISATAGTHGLQNFDVAYEQLSGHALIVYGTATADELRKIEWVNGAWTSDAAITTTKTSGTVEWVELTSQRGSDQIAIGYADSNDEVSAYRWSGTSAANEATAVITATASQADVRKFDISFEGISGDMIIASPLANAGTTAFGHMTSAGTWTIVANTEPDNITAFIDLQEQGPDDDVAMLAHGSTTANNPTEGYELNGATPNTTTTGMVDATVAVDTTTTVWGVNYMMTSVAYLSPTYYAVGVFSDVTGADDINWFTMNNAGVWTAQTDNTRTRGTIRFTSMFDYPNQNKVLLLSSDSNSDLWIDTNAGTTTGATAWVDRTSAGAVETALSSATTKVYDFAFRLSPAILGVLYTDNGITADTSGRTIKMAVGTSTLSVHTATTTTGGEWAFNNVLINATSGTPFTIWHDGTTNDATTIVSGYVNSFSTTSLASSSITNVPLYYGHTVVYGATSTASSTASTTSQVNFANFYNYDSTDDADILYTFQSTSTATTSSHLFIKQGEFIPTENLNITGDYTNQGRFGGAGENWLPRSADANAWYAVTYGNGIFVAVAGSGSNRVMTSTDGITWTPRSVAGNNDIWEDVTYGNGMFVAVGSGASGDHVMYSSDGTTWTTTTAAGDDDAWYEVTYGNGLFVAVSGSANGTTRVMTSPDGITWTAGSEAGNNDDWYSLVYGKGIFVAVGNSTGAGDSVMYSSDGITWATSTALGDNDLWLSVTYGNGLFVAVGNTGDRIMTSPDGITWTARSAAGDNDDWFGVTYGNGLFVATGYSGTDRVITSADGINWKLVSAVGNDDGWRDVTYGNGMFVAVGNSGDRVMTSKDSSLFFSTTSPQFLAGNLTGASQLRNVTFNGSTTNNTIAPTHGLLGYWNFENSEVNWTSASAGTVNDLSGNGYTGTMASMSSSTSPVIGKVGQAFDFDAVDDAVTIDAARQDDFNPGTGSFSVSVWAKPENINQTGAFVAKRRSGGNYERWWVGACITTACTAGKRIYFSNIGVTPGDARVLITNSDVVDGNWHHVVAVTDADSQTIKLYVDGVEPASTLTSTGAWPDITHTSPVQFGASTAGSFELNGAVDEVRYYNRALSAAEVTALYNEKPKVFSDNASTTDLTINSSIAVAPKALTVAGNYTNSDTFRAGLGTTTFSGNVPQTLSGNMTASSSFYNAHFLEAGTKKLLSNASTTNFFVASSSGDVVLPPAFDVSRDYTNNGVTTHAGAVWTARSVAGNNDSWRDITYANGLFVAVGNSGDRVITSTDGINWDVRTPPVSAGWYGVTYGNGLYVVTASGGEIITSPDGITWTQRTAPAGGAWLDVAYGNGTFVAGGWNACATACLMYSTDGINWATTTPPVNNSWYGVTYGGGLFVAVGYGIVTKSVITSPDGINWTARDIGANDGRWISVDYGNGMFVAVGGYLDNSQKVATSPDGINWTVRSVSGNNDNWWDVTFCDGLFVAVATSTTNGVFTSPDGINWREYPSVFTSISYQSDIACGNGIMVAVSSGDTNRVMTAHDTTTFFSGSTSQNISGNLTGASTFRDVVFNGTGSKTFASSSASTTSFTVASTSGEVITPQNLSVAGDYENRGSVVQAGRTWSVVSALGDNDTWRDVVYAQGLFVAISSGGDRIMTSPDGLIWTVRTVGTNNNSEGIAYGNGMFVVVGNAQSVVLTSPDGLTWSTSTAPSASGWNGIAYGNGLFVAVADTGTDRVMTSPDGVNWTARSAAGNDDYWYGVTYGNGLFVAVAYRTTADRIMTSPDGINWTVRSVGGNDDGWIQAAYGNGVYVAVAFTGNDRVAYSYDGLTWATTSVAGNDDSWWGVTYGNGLFVAVGTSTSHSVITSPDGVNWTAVSAAGDNDSWRFVTYGDGKFVAVGCHQQPCVTSTGSDRVMISYDTNTFFDGSNDQTISGDLTGDSLLRSVIFEEKGTKTFIDTASTTDFMVATSSGEVITSTNIAIAGDYENRGRVSHAGTVWATTSVAGNNDNWGDVIYAEDQFVAVGYSGDDRLMTSPDGLTWTVRTAPEANSWRGIAYGNGRYVAVSNTGTNRVIYSLDGINWATSSAAQANQWYAVTYGNGTFVAVSRDGTDRVMYSYNGINWATTSAAEVKEWWGITYGNGLFVAVTTTGGSNQVMTSPDGINWTARATTGIDGDWNAVTYGNGRFVAVSYNNDLVMWSDDGINWTASDVPNNDDWWDVTYGDGLFVAIGTSTAHSNLIMTSPDGITWTSREVPDGGESWYGIGYGNGRFVGVGYGGPSRVMTSSDTSTFFTSVNDQVISGNLTGASQLRAVNFEEKGSKTFEDNASTTNFTVGSASSTGEVIMPQNIDIAGDYANLGAVANFGVNWTTVTAAENDDNWGDVIYAEDQFVAVGYSGDDRLMTSPDGVNWTTVSVAGNNDGWNEITYGNGRFVAVSCGASCSTAGDVVMYSDDGVTWATTSAAGNNDDWYAVTYGNGVFVAGAIAGDTRVMNSTDGITWTPLSVLGDDDGWSAIVYGGGQFVAVARSGGNRIMTSPDGTNWTPQSALGDNDSWNSVTYGNGLYVASAFAGDHRLMTSPDGVNWTARYFPDSNNFTGSVRFLNGLFFAFNGNTARGHMTSPDGINWTVRSVAGDDDSWAHPAYGNGTLVYVSLGGSNRVMYSKVGTTTFNGSNAQDISGKLYGEGTFGNVQFTGEGAKTFSDRASTTNIYINNRATTTFASTLHVYDDFSASAGARISLADNATTTIKDQLLLAGTSTNLVYLVSETSGQASNLVLLGSSTITNTYVQDSNACGSIGGGITATSSTDGGNNTCWTFTSEGGAVNFYVTGILYEANRTTPYATSTTVKLNVATSTTNTFSTTTVATTGAFSFSVSAGTVATGTPITVFIDGSAVIKAVTVTKTANSGANTISNLPLYKNHVTIKNEATGTTTKASDLVHYDSVNDSDIQFTASSTLGTLNALGTTTLYVASGTTFHLDYPTTAHGFVVATTTSTVLASSTLTLTGNYANFGTFTAGTSTVYASSSAPTSAYTGFSFDTAASGNTTPQGIVSYGSYIYVTDNAGSQVYRYNSDGTYSGFTFDTAASGNSNPVGITVYNDYLYVVDLGDAEVYRYNLDGTYSGFSFDTAASGNALPYSITAYNDYFYVIDNTDDEVYRYNSDGTYSGFSFDTAASGNTSTFGITTYNGFLFSTDSTDTEVYIYTMTGAYTGVSFDIASSGNGTAYGITAHNGYFYIVDGADDEVYQYNVGQGFSGNMTGSSAFNDIVFTGSSGKDFVNNASTTGNFTISTSSGEVRAPLGLSIAGNYTNSTSTGFNANSGTTTFSGTGTQTIAGFATGTSAFDNVVFSGTGTKYFATSSSASTTNFVVNTGSGEVITSPALTVSGNYVNNSTTTMVGLNWVARSAAGNDDGWRGVTYGNGRFVAVSPGIDTVMTSPDGITWTAQTTAGITGQWWGVAYGEGLFVAVGVGSGADRLMTSPDGVNWTRRDIAGNDDNWRAVVYAQGQFVAVACGTNATTACSGAGDRVATSPDGITWTTFAIDPGNTDGWIGITYGNGLYVAVSAVGDQVMTSPDGVDWTAQTNPTGSWISVAYGNGNYVAVSYASTNRIMSSPDGVTWTSRLDSTGSKSLEYVIFANGTFVAVGNTVMTSPDGITWTEHTILRNNDAWRSMAYGNGRLVAVGIGGDRVMTLDDTSLIFSGNEDQTISGNLDGGSSFRSVSFTGSGIKTITNNASTTNFTIAAGTTVVAPVAVAIANNATNTGELITSAGDTWVSASGTEASIYYNVAFGEGIFVAVSSGGTKRVITSSDGINWTKRDAAEQNRWISVTYGDGKFVAVADSGTNRSMYSFDGITWATSSAAENNLWYGVTYGDGQFVAVSCSGTNRVMTSPDGISWSPQLAAEANCWTSVTYGGGQFVAVADSGTNRVMTSPDGINWSPQLAAEANSWNSISYGNGRFVSVAYSGTNRVMYSLDGITWATSSATQNIAWYGITYGNGMFLAVGTSTENNVMTSPDGITWTAYNGSENSVWWGAVYGNERFVVVGGSGSRAMASQEGRIYLNGSSAQTVTGTLTGTSRLANVTISNRVGTTTFGSALEVGTLNMPVIGSIAYLKSSATSTINNLNITGSSSQLTKLRSTTYGTQSSIDVVDSYDISYLDVKDSNACGSVNGWINAGDTSTDSGNNNCWFFFAGDGDTVTVTGVLYESDRITPYATSTLVKLNVATSTINTFSATTTAGTGAFSFSALISGNFATGTPVTIFTDGSAVIKAVTVTKSNGTTTLSSLPLYKDHITITNQGIGSTTKASDLVHYDSVTDSDIQFTASSTLGTLAVATGQTLYVASGTTFHLDYPTTAHTLEIATTSTFLASSTLSLSGNYQNNGTFYAGNSTTTFANNVEAQLIAGNLSGASTFNHLAFTSTSTQGSTDGLVGYWNFENNSTRWYTTTDGTFYDVSPYGNHGTDVAMFATTSVAGKIGQGITFDGVDDFIEVADDDSFTMGDNPVTIASWVKFTSAASTSYQFIVTQNNDSFELNKSSTNALRMEMICSNATARRANESVASLTQPDRWYHVVGIFTPTTGAFQFYVDGSSRAVTYIDAQSPCTIKDSSNLVWIGLRGGMFLKGSVDELRIYNRALDATEVAALYNEKPKIFNNDATANNFIVNSGIIVSPTNLNISGNYTNLGTYRGGISNTNFNGSGAQLLSGNMTESSTFASTTFSNTGTKTFADNASTTNFMIASSTTTVVAPSVLHVGGYYTNNGTFTNNSGTVLFGSEVTSIATYTGESFSTSGSGNANPTGSVIAEGYLWIADEVDDRIYKYNTDGTYTGVNFSTAGSGATNPHGLTYGDGYLWISDYVTSIVYQYTTAGTYTGFSFSITGAGAGGTPYGITFADGYLWIASDNQDDVYKFNTDGTYTGISFDTAGAGNNIPNGITYAGGYFWVTDWGDDRVYQYTASGTYTGNFFGDSNTINGPTGIVYIDGYLWVNGFINVRAYKFSLGQLISGNLTGTSAFNTVEFGDSNQKFIITPLGTTDFTIKANSGPVTAPTSTLTISGNYTNNNSDGFIHNSGTTTFNGSVSQILSGTMTNVSAFNNILFSGSGTKTFASTSASTTNFVVQSGSGEVIAPSALTVSGNYSNNSTTSMSGSRWTAYSATQANSWGSLAYGNGKFVAVSYNGTNRVMYSTDGITWATSTAAQANLWFAITYGNGKFVAVSGDGTNRVMYSTDGITWATSTAAQANPWYSVAYGNGKFVAVSYNGTNRVMYSTDGITWATSSAPEANAWYSVTYGNGKFVAVACGINSTTCNFTGGGSRVMSSTDGINWVGHSATSASEWYAVTYGNGLFVAVARSGSDLIMTSPDGANWTARSAPESNFWLSVTYGNGLFVALATNGTNRVMTSPNGITWTPYIAAEDNAWYDVVYGNGKFVAVAGNGTNRVMTSDDTTAFFNSSADQTISGNLTGASQLRSVNFGGLGTKTFSSNASTTNFFIATSTATVTAPTILSVSGDFTNRSNFNDNSGTVILSGENQTVLGTTTFHNLTKFATDRATTTFEAGALFTIENNFTFSGYNATNTHALRSSVDGTQWKIDPQGTRTLSYLDVKDSNNINVTTVSCGTGCIDGTGNTNWSFAGVGFDNLSSGDNYHFYVGQGTTTLDTIFITSEAAAATDLRLTIATTTTNFRFDTGTTNLTLTGTGASKVSTSVTYENGGATLVLNVTNNLSLGDTLGVSGIKVGSFASVSTTTSAFTLHTDGNIIGAPAATDSKTIRITGRLAVTNHASGQVGNEFNFQNKVDKPIFAFNLQAIGENATITDMVVTLSGVQGIDSSNISDFKLYRDNNNNQTLDGPDLLIDGSGILTVNGQHGAITFSTDFVASSSVNYFVTADINSISVGDAVVVKFLANGITALGATSQYSPVVVVDTSAVQHARGGSGAGGSSARIGDDAPPGAGVVTGGDEGGGGEDGAGEPQDGANIAPDNEFFRPTTTGSPDNEWTNGANALLSDGTYATAGNSNLKQSYSNFNFGIPTNNTIQGIAVKIDASGTTPAGTIDVLLSWDGGGSYTAAKATPTLSGSDVVYTVGGPGDTWGRTWTASEFGSLFHLRVSAQVSANSVRLDALEIRVYHQAGGGGSGGGGGI